MRRRRALALALLVAAPAGVRAAAAGDPVVARRLEGRIVLDGRLDDPAWERAEPFDGFVQLFPRDGAAPSQETVVRVLFDDRALYVGVLCRDREPARIVRTLGRRDAIPYSDYVALYVDSMHDRRTAFAFGVNAGGVQEDVLHYDDESATGEWDAVWGGAAAIVAEGWSAEMEIPLSALRISDAAGGEWGFGVVRLLARGHEESATFPRRRGERGFVSRLGVLTGLDDLEPGRRLEVLPYVAARLSYRPEVPGTPEPRVLDPIGDVGLDLRASLGRSLAIQGTLNPDFGQVEADQILQNLTTYELAFPEKRPFFTQGMDLFQPVTPWNEPSPQQLFYSRRIGLDAPILGAAKLTGRVGSVQVGALAAYVTGAGQTDLDGAVWDASQPFHVAPARSYPDVAPDPQGFLAATARWQQAPHRTYGVLVTSARDGNAAALDLSLRSSDSAWFLRGQVTGSQVRGDPSILLDGTPLERGDLGFGAFASAGRKAGDGFWFDVNWEYESPRLELNALGFQPTQNRQAARANVSFVRPRGGGPFLDWDVGVGGQAAFTTDGRGLHRALEVWAWAEGHLTSFQKLGCDGKLSLPTWDVREIRGSGIAYGRPLGWSADCWVSTKQSAPIWVQGTAGYRATRPAGPFLAMGGWFVQATGSFRPHPRLETRLDVQYADSRQPARWLGDDGAGTFFFGDMHAPALSLTLRQAVVLAPRLSLQAYAQVFTTYRSFATTYAAVPAAGRIEGNALVPAPLPPGLDDPDFRDAALNLNLVLRWEYRLGSTLFVVYTRSEAQPDGVPPEPSLAPPSPGNGAATDTFLVKWTYWWSR
ncbi:MAG TPA: DUF5916 domain-containing protein [Anaeromyxobacteraceae bacterium]|nr:DUF5916 domain-containing protein [Anaeromyxobacteraceae bacterium]